MTFGELVRGERRSAKLTQQELADKVNVSKMTIRRIEAISTDEELKSIRLETIVSIARVLKSYEIMSMAAGGYGMPPGYDSENWSSLERSAPPESIMDLFNQLNALGQKRVMEYARDLLDNPKYRNTEEE